MTDLPIDYVIGQHLNALRKQHHVSQHQLAQYLTQFTGKQWDQQLVSRAENGKRPFRVNDLFAIAGIFQVGVLSLMFPTNEKDQLQIGRLVITYDGLLRSWLGQPRRPSGDDTIYATRMPPPIDDFEERVDRFLTSLDTIEDLQQIKKENT